MRVNSPSPLSGIQRAVIGGGWMESLDEDGEKGKKRGDIPRSFLLVVFLVFLSREEDIFSSMTHNCLIHEDNLRKEREIRFSKEKILLLKLYMIY